MIDLHCHIDLYPDPHRVVAECRDRKMYVLSVTTTPTAWRKTAELAKGADRIRTALGLHPQLAHERSNELPLFDELVPETRFVGEIGLDGAPEFRRHWSAQMSVFDHVLRASARAGGRILSVHSRRASRDVLDRLEANREAGVPILHWFSGSLKDLDRAIALDCWFSVGPAMLRSEKGRVLAARMPRDRVLTESDGPFAQINGQPLMPWSVDDALYGLAELWSISQAECETLVDDNLRKLTSLVPDVR